MGIISVEQADRLYWLGRYIERAYTTIRFYFVSFDYMIDEIIESYPEYCRMIDIPNIYTDKMDFLHRYPYDPENSDSIISNVNRAYDNAIVLRETIGSEALSYIQLIIYDMSTATKNPAPLMELQKVIDNILAFWGIIDDNIDDAEIRNILKAGKRIERIDLYARVGRPQPEIAHEVKRLIPRVEGCGLKYDTAKLETLKELSAAPEIDHYAIVNEVESIF